MIDAQSATQTGIRLNRSTVKALHTARAELTLVSGEHLPSLDATLLALLRHWNATKHSVYGINTAPVTTPDLAQPAA